MGKRTQFEKYSNVSDKEGRGIETRLRDIEDLPDEDTSSRGDAPCVMGPELTSPRPGNTSACRNYRKGQERALGVSLNLECFPHHP